MSIFHSFAYLDFQTGSVIVQAIVGAVAGVALFGRRLIVRVKQKLGLIKLDEDDKIELSSEEKDSSKQATTVKTPTKKTNTKKGSAKVSAKKSGRK